jgi:uncharacterized sodium:solute symporter family permease YidK
MPSQRSTRAAFQLWWGRTFRIVLRVVFVVWIVLGGLGAVMSIIDPIGIIVGGLVVVAGVVGLRATRRPFHEWGIASLIPGVQDQASAIDAPPTLKSTEAIASESDVTSRPNKSLERTREG